MTKIAAAPAPTGKRRAPARERQQTLKAVMASGAVQAALAGNSNFVFPKMSGAAAAELMKAAGILTPAGKLTKSYR